MKKAGLMKELMVGAAAYLGPMGYEWNAEASEWWCEKPDRIDRIYTNIWAPDERLVTMAFYRHLSEIEKWRELVGPLNDGSQEGRRSVTIHTGRVRIETKSFDLRSYGPYHSMKLDPFETAENVLATFRESLEQVIFPCVNQYVTIESLDQFLHHDIERLATEGPKAFYTSKGWLLEYRWLYAKSLYIAKLMGNPNAQLIYDVYSEFMRPHIGQGSAANDQIAQVFEKVWKG